jgi:peptide/nickel transport system permease protein
LSKASAIATPARAGGSAPRRPSGGAEDALAPESTLAVTPSDDLAPRAPRAHRRLPVWTPWFVGRLVSSAAAILAISVVVFAATQALPSDPARVILGPDAPEETVHILQHQLGLDRPLPEQYGRWLGRAVVGDFGRSLDSHAPVLPFVARRLGNTLALLAGVMLTVVPAALLLGVLLAVRRDSRLDRIAVTAMIVFKALPPFAVAIGLVLLLATSVLRVLPAVSLLEPGRSLLGQWRALVLPVITLSISGLPYLVRLVRGSMIEVLETDYVVQARLRGIPERRILWGHALPNALIPAIQGLALTLGVLIGGALVVELVFAYPGIGSALNVAVGMRDVPVIQATVLVLTVGVVSLNLGADLLTILLTPRLRTA